jgi:hypothetical protein
VQSTNAYTKSDQIVKRRIPPDSLIHNSVKTRYEKIQGKFRSPAFRDFFESVDEDWARVRVEL